MKVIQDTLVHCLQRGRRQRIIRVKAWLTAESNQVVEHTIAIGTSNDRLEGVQCD
jgi:hypothetical protein